MSYAKRLSGSKKTSALAGLQHRQNQVEASVYSGNVLTGWTVNRQMRLRAKALKRAAASK